MDRMVVALIVKWAGIRESIWSCERCLRLSRGSCGREQHSEPCPSPGSYSGAADPMDPIDDGTAGVLGSATGPTGSSHPEALLLHGSPDQIYSGIGFITGPLIVAEQGDQRRH